MKPIAMIVPRTAIAAATLAAGVFVAAHHPLSAAVALVSFIAVAVFCGLMQNGWLLLLPALLPVSDLAPWTGWISLEEFDLVVLAAAAGTYLRSVWEPAPARSRLSLSLVVLGGMFAVSVIVAFMRGIADAGGFQFGWHQGYDGPMNSLRVAKPYLLALLFVPFMKTALMRPEAKGTPMLAWGMALGLGGASLAAVWERLVFPGLLNFSADYRTTALFWEMHVGGAAFDGFLALTVPFAVWLLLHIRNVLALALAGIICALGIYASLTTFSRGVYAAEVVALAVFGVLLMRQRAGTGASQGASSVGPAPVIRSLIWVVAVGVGSYVSFRHGGYRGLVAVLGVLAVTLACSPMARCLAAGQRWAAAVGGGLVGVVIAALSLLVPKGVYGTYGVLMLLAAGTIFKARREPGWRLACVSTASASPVLAAAVAWYWGGGDALFDAIAVLVPLAVLAAWNAGAKVPVWPEAIRMQALALVGVAALALGVTIFSGGRYMEGRFATTEQDFDYRLRHWQAALALMNDPWQWLLGKGAGRFPVNFFFGAPDAEFPGTYRIADDAGNAYLALSGAHYRIGYGETLRIVQHVALTPGNYRVDFDARAQKPAKLDIAVCEKHLLYVGNCTFRRLSIAAAEGWQHWTTELDARRLDPGHWYAPRPMVFSVALDRVDTRIDVDNLKLIDVGGRNLLANGSFTDGMSRWFFTSDRHHMPWHMKSMFLHVLFEQGLLGFAAFLGLIGVALGKVAFARSSRHPIAPALAAGIVGFLIVGLFDSLLDVPRVAFLFFLMMLMAIQSSRKTR